LPINTRREVSELAGVSERTLPKVETVVQHAPESVKAKARSGEISTQRAYDMTKALQGKPQSVIDLALRVAGDNPEKVDILAQLHKSGKRDGSNETFAEIEASGGFHTFGKDKDDKHWCDFAGADIRTIKTALASIAKQHRETLTHEKTQALVNHADAVVPKDDLQGILTGDAAALFDHLADNSVDLFLTDPPYLENMLDTYTLLSRLAAQKLKPGGLCLAYSGQMFLPEVMRLMSGHLTYWWMFAVAHTGQALAIWNRAVQTKWRSVLVYAKPYADGRLPAALDHVVDIVDGGGRKKEWHAWGQDANEVTYWIERLTQTDALICDPFVGGGAIPVACKLTGRRWIGTEINVQQAQIARMRVLEALT
jgi:hypothetical protein